MRLTSFVLGVYDELMRAEITAKGLQAEYFVQMSQHMAPMAVSELVHRAVPQTISVSLHFRQLFLSYTLWDKLLIVLKLRKKLPEGTYLLLSNAASASLSLSVSVNYEESGKITIQPQLSENMNYYVVTKTN
jgi:hypothetical protein